MCPSQKKSGGCIWPDLMAASYGIFQNGSVAVLKVIASSSQNTLSAMCCVFWKINNAIKSANKSIFMNKDERSAFSCIKFLLNKLHAGVEERDQVYILIIIAWLNKFNFARCKKKHFQKNESMTPS